MSRYYYICMQVNVYGGNGQFLSKKRKSAENFLLKCCDSGTDPVNDFNHLIAETFQIRFTDGAFVEKTDKNIRHF